MRVVENIRIGLLGSFVIRVWILTRIYESRAEFKLGEWCSLGSGVPLSSHKDWPMMMQQRATAARFHPERFPLRTADWLHSNASTNHKASAGRARGITFTS